MTKKEKELAPERNKVNQNVFGPYPESTSSYSAFIMPVNLLFNPILE